MSKKPNDASSENGKEKFEVADVFRLYGQDYRLNNPYHLIIPRSCVISKSVGLQPSEVILNNAINAGLNASLITHAETGIAQSAKP